MSDLRMANSRSSILTILGLLLFLCLSTATAQTSDNKKNKTKADANAGDALLNQQRAFAASMLMTLADEARSYDNPALRAQVLARSADALWNVDSIVARSNFRRAWEAAEKADAEDSPPSTGKNAVPVMVIALRKIGGYDQRTEVLTLVSKRDQALAEEFLAKLAEDTKRAAEDTKNQATTQTPDDSWTTSVAATKRLLVAHRLLDEGQVDRAFEFARPVLNEVNEKTIGFLSALRPKKPELADQAFVTLLSIVERSPSADANTVSGLSSYVFSPGFYVTFSADGSVRWTPTEEDVPLPILPVEIRGRFFIVAGNILLRPLPPPDQDITSSGRTGKFLVIKRLLPLFEQFAPDTAVALRSQLTELSGEEKNSAISNENSLLNQGVTPTKSGASLLEDMQARLDRANNSFERDAIYEDVAAALANEGNPKALDLADKVDKKERRERLKTYVDLSLIRFAVKKQDAAAVLKLAAGEELSHTQRAWAFTQAAKLFLKMDRTRGSEVLEAALVEARRIDADDPNKAELLVGIAALLNSVDRLSSWEVITEAVKAGNGSEQFTGENMILNVAIMTRSGLKLLELDGEDFSLKTIFGSLAKEDSGRASELAKSFQSQRPRSVAIMAVAVALLEKPKKV